MFLLTAVLIHWLYSEACCADKDCHPVPCDEIVNHGEGWQWRGIEFYHHMMRDAPDGNCHVCVHQSSSLGPKMGVCIYLPTRS